MEKKNIILICVSILVIVLLFFAGNINNKETNKEKYKDKVVEIKVKDYGSIIVELDYDNAPITVDNFINLIEDKFYDALDQFKKEVEIATDPDL